MAIKKTPEGGTLKINKEAMDNLNVTNYATQKKGSKFEYKVIAYILAGTLIFTTILGIAGCSNKISATTPSAVATETVDEDELVIKVVTTKNTGSNLHLRSSEGKEDDNIIKDLPYGSIVYTTNEELEKLESSDEVDGHLWTKVELPSGEIGYVASGYLSSPIEKYVNVNVTDQNYSGDLNLREAPGVDSQKVGSIKNGNVVYITKRSYENSVKVGNHEWVLVSLLDGTMGYVAKKYLSDECPVETKEVKKEEKTTKKAEEKAEEGQKTEELEVVENTTVSSNNDIQATDSSSEKEKHIYNKYSLDLGAEGVVDGVICIDCWTYKFTPKEFEAILDGSKPYTDDFPKVNNFVSPAAVIFKIGSTGWGKTFKFATTTDQKNLEECVKICERRGIPFGFYYYSQAISQDEAIKELDHLSKLLARYDEYKCNVLPVSIDVENKDDKGNLTRLGDYTKNNSEHKIEVTRAINYLINEIRKVSKNGAILYTERWTLRESLNTNYFDEINKKNVWLVDPSPKHSNDIAKNYSDLDIAIRQIEIDYPNYRDPHSVDYDFIDADYYEECLKRLPND